MTHDTRSMFERACAAYREHLMEFHHLAMWNDRTWAENDWKRIHDEYHDIRAHTFARLPREEADARMGELHPELRSQVDLIEAHAAKLAGKRDALLAESHRLGQQALADLGALLAPKVVDVFDTYEGDGGSLEEILAPILKEASKLRKEHLDGRGLAMFDGYGPFTNAVLRPLADHLGIDARHKSWIRDIETAFAGSSTGPMVSH